MLARDIEVGDVLRDPETGEIIYTVERLLTNAGHFGCCADWGDGHEDATCACRPTDVKVLVRYAVDGGDGIRAWAPDAEAPLARPVSA